MIYSAVKCDKCGAGISYSTFQGKTRLRTWARRDGWSFGKKDLCPSCKNKRKEVFA